MQQHRIFLQLSNPEEEVFTQRLPRNEFLTDHVYLAVDALDKVGVAVNPRFENGQEDVQTRLPAIDRGRRTRRFQLAHRLGEYFQLALSVGEKHIFLQNERNVLHVHFTRFNSDKTKVNLNGLVRLNETRTALDLLHFLRGKELDFVVPLDKFAFLLGGRLEVKPYDVTDIHNFIELRTLVLLQPVVLNIVNPDHRIKFACN